MVILEILVPLALLVYFLAKGRKKPIFVCAIPILLGFGRSAFIDIMPDQTPAIQDILFFTVVAGWLYARAKRPTRESFLSRRGIKIAIVMLFYLGFELILMRTQLTGIGFFVTLQVMKWLYFPVSFLIMVDTYRRFDRNEMMDLLGSLSKLAVLLMFFYIGSSAFGLKIYPYEKYQEVMHEGTYIARDFSTFPYWAGLAVAFFVSRARFSLSSIGALCILYLGFFFRYTRSWLILAIFLWVIAIVLQLFKSGYRKRAGKTLMAFSLLGVGLFFALPIVAPAQYDFFEQRMNEMFVSGSILAVQNMYVRIQLFLDAFQAGYRQNSLFGQGLMDPVVGPRGSFHSYDSDWIYIVYRLGVAGLAIFAIPLLVALWAGLRTFFRQRERVAHTLSLILFSLVFYFSIMRITDIVYLWWFSLSVWPLALVAIDYYDLWRHPYADKVAKMTAMSA